MTDKEDKFIQNLNKLAKHWPVGSKENMGVPLEKGIICFLKHKFHFAQTPHEQVKKLLQQMGKREAL